jgi:hypothetical protein
MSKGSGVQSLADLSLSCDWFEEPLLQFGKGGFHADPTVGIPLYGPWSLGSSRHKAEVHVGFIGTGTGIQMATQFYEKCCEGIDGDDTHAPFPGCKPDRGFRMALRMSDSQNEKITQGELAGIISIRNQKDRFIATLDLLLQKFRVLCERDQPIDYVCLIIPAEVRKRCGVADYHEKGVGMVHRDLRRAFKAAAMAFKTPTQLLMEDALSPEVESKDLDHLSTRAWNLFTGLYFKIDGLPWGPAKQAASTCHVGVSFYRPLGSSSTLRTSLAQAFDENGEGLILRGHSFQWDEEKEGKSPHLTEAFAGKLIEMVLEKYHEVRHHYPKRVVIHKSSRYDMAERKGFQEGLKKVSEYDLISLTPRSNVRLIRAGSYPPLRGTSFRAGQVTYLYTTGYLPSIGAFQQGHVPSPLELTDHVGDTHHSQIMREILALTKMNWNSARMYGLMPITLRFSRLVGDILREFPIGEGDPSPKYKYYM